VIPPYLRQVILPGILLVLPACTPTGPTGPEIEDTLQRQTEDATWSVAGPWTGVAAGGAIRFQFSLTQAPEGQVQGTGTMREANAEADIPIRVSGTYNRPNLSLTFTGMVYEGREVSGTFAEAYMALAGVGGSLRLTGEDYARSLFLLLQEQ
jgi:hypothetical protein